MAIACMVVFAVCAWWENAALPLGSPQEGTSSALSALMGIELIPAELIPIYHLSTSSRDQGGYNGGGQVLPILHPLRRRLGGCVSSVGEPWLRGRCCDVTPPT